MPPYFTHGINVAAGRTMARRQRRNGERFSKKSVAKESQVAPKSWGFGWGTIFGAVVVAVALKGGDMWTAMNRGTTHRSTETNRVTRPNDSNLAKILKENTELRRTNPFGARDQL